MPVPQSKGDPLLVTTDERPRRDTSLEALARLKPAFRKDGTVTAGNSSGLNDGAAALLLMSAERAARAGLTAAGARGRLGRGGRAAADDGHGAGAGDAQSAASGPGCSLEEIGLVELNEAFAVQSLAVMQELGLDRSEITNVNGGAIALGHPLGCSGARILTTLLHEMRRRGAGRTHGRSTAWRPCAWASARARPPWSNGWRSVNADPRHRFDRFYRLAACAGRWLPGGHRVRAFHRPTSSLRVLEGLEVEHAVGDITQPDSLERRCKGWRSSSTRRPAGWFHRCKRTTG